MARPPVPRLWTYRFARRCLSALRSALHDVRVGDRAAVATWTAAIAGLGHVAASAAARWVPLVEVSFVGPWLRAPALSAATVAGAALALVLARLTDASTIALLVGATAVLAGVAGPALVFVAPTIAAALLVAGLGESFLRAVFSVGRSQ